MLWVMLQSMVSHSPSFHTKVHHLQSVRISKAQADAHSSNAILEVWPEAGSYERCARGRDTLKDLAVVVVTGVGTAAVRLEAWVWRGEGAGHVEVVGAAGSCTACVPVLNRPLVALWQAGGCCEALWEGDSETWCDEGSCRGEDRDELHVGESVMSDEICGWSLLLLEWKDDSLPSR